MVRVPILLHCRQASCRLFDFLIQNVYCILSMTDQGQRIPHVMGFRHREKQPHLIRPPLAVSLSDVGIPSVWKFLDSLRQMHFKVRAITTSLSHVPKGVLYALFFDVLKNITAHYDVVHSG